MNLGDRIKNSSEEKEKSLDRTAVYTSSVEKTILWLGTTMFGAIFFGILYFDIQIGSNEILLMFFLFTSIFCSLFNMFLTVQEQKYTLDAHNYELFSLYNNDNDEYYEKFRLKKSRAITMAGLYGSSRYQTFLLANIALIVALLLFAMSCFNNVEKINNKNIHDEISVVKKDLYKSISVVIENAIIESLKTKNIENNAVQSISSEKKADDKTNTCQTSSNVIVTTNISTNTVTISTQTKVSKK